MNELLYTAQDLAIILIGMDLDCRIESAVMDRIWNREKEFLAEPYRQDRRRFTLEVLYWRYYFSEKTALDRELPVVQKDLESGGHTVDLEEYRSDYADLNLFFKSVRIRCLYGMGKEYVRIKLRTLLAVYGYRRRSRRLIRHMQRCMEFYHLKATLRGGTDCDLSTCSLDQMLTFRVEQL